MFINLSVFDYVKTINKTGILTTDLCNLLDINNKKDTKEHVLNVAETNIKLADKFKLNSEKCYKSALLHDVSAIIKPEDMIKIAKNINIELDISEKKYPFLLHQRISKILAVDYFNITDKDILSSIECHSKFQ